MVLVVEKKFLEGEWWKYALALFLLQVFFWVLMGYKINPNFELPGAFFVGVRLLTAFLVMASVPFIAGRLQLRSIFWFGLAGFLLGAAAYHGLSLFGAGRRFSLLPFIGFLQIYVSCFGLGVVVEFGRYVLKKLEE